jgi:hypothetical protein
MEFVGLGQVLDLVSVRLQKEFRMCWIWNAISSSIVYVQQLVTMQDVCIQ